MERREVDGAHLEVLAQDTHHLAAVPPRLQHGPGLTATATPPGAPKRPRGEAVQWALEETRATGATSGKPLAPIEWRLVIGRPPFASLPVRQVEKEKRLDQCHSKLLSHSPVSPLMAYNQEGQ